MKHTRKFKGLIFERLDYGLWSKPQLKKYRETHQEQYSNFRCILEPKWGWAVYGKPKQSN
jgi:hypothetical protein